MERLLERHSALGVLSAALSSAAQGRGATVLVSGEPGVGKTALVAAFLSAQSSIPTYRGACEDLFSPRPLGPLHDMARHLGGGVPEALERGGPERIFSAVLEALPSRGDPAIVVIEDLHWADEATLDLVKFLGRRIGTLPVVLVVTYRDSEVRMPLRRTLGDLPSGAVHRIPLLPLSEAAVAQLAEASGRSSTGLHAATSGNPFFVTEVLASAGDALPATVRDAVLGRVLRLPPQAMALLEVASLVPGRAEQWVLQALVPQSDETVDVCLQAGILLLDGNALRFRHELARRAVEDALSPVRQRVLHARILGVLEGDTEHRVAEARRVHHAERAGDEAAVLRMAPIAARAAAAVGAHVEAAAHYGVAVRCSGGFDAAARARLLEHHAYECYLTEQIRAALESRRAALSLWMGLGRRREQGENLRWVSRLLWFLGDGAEAARYADEAISVLETLPPGRELAMAYSNRAQLFMLCDELREAELWATRAIALAQPLEETEILVHALNNQGNARWYREPDQGRTDVEKSLELALAENLEEHVGRALCNLSCRSVVVRDYAAAAGYLDHGIRYCADRDLHSWDLYMTAWRARMHLERGDWSRAAEDAHAVLSQARTAPVARLPALVVLGQVRTRRGDPGADTLLDEARELASRTTELQRIGPVSAARAEAAWLVGGSDRVSREVRDAYALSLTRDDPWTRGELAVWMWRAGALAEVPEDIAEPYRLHVGGDPLGAARAWEAFGCAWDQALALVDVGTPAALQEALVLVEGLGAGPAVQWIRQRLRACGVRGVPRGPRASTVANPASLTARQLEILGLLTEGLQNAEIARRLFVSPKTVDHHVSAILAKLGARSRGEAAAAAIRMGIDLSGPNKDGERSPAK